MKSGQLPFDFGVQRSGENIKTVVEFSPTHSIVVSAGKPTDTHWISVLITWGDLVTNYIINEDGDETIPEFIDRVRYDCEIQTSWVRYYMIPALVYLTIALRMRFHAGQQEGMEDATTTGPYMDWRQRECLGWRPWTYRRYKETERWPEDMRPDVREVLCRTVNFFIARLYKPDPKYGAVVDKAMIEWVEAEYDKIGSVNWGDLSCTDVEVKKSEGSGPMYIITVEEAYGDGSDGMSWYLNDMLRKLGWPAWVKLEW